ncbi:MAG: thymidylate kinase [Candidatus Sumerlaeia bacterium]|nr:thymidylate kinase [Candidatus Sumerlaeia bacterium]
MSQRQFYGTPPPGAQPESLGGKLIVIEGADGSGRSTQIALINEWLERNGHATVQVGLRRSTLVSAELEKAKQGNTLGRITMSLFYATDFADQLDNIIIPALRAGFVVLADRYIYTLMARAIVRGCDRRWLESLYGIAVVPDVVFYLKTTPQQLVERNFQKKDCLDYWESGMDIGLSADMFESFMKYQKMIEQEFRRMQKQYGFIVIDGNRPIRTIAADLQKHIEAVL